MGRETVRIYDMTEFQHIGALSGTTGERGLATKIMWRILKAMRIVKLFSRVNAGQYRSGAEGAAVPAADRLVSAAPPEEDAVSLREGRRYREQTRDEQLEAIQQPTFFSENPREVGCAIP